MGAHATDRAAVYSLLRFVLGLNIALHGFTRVIAGTAKFADTMVGQFAATPLPGWSVHLFAVCLPWAEIAVGVAVFLGVATRLVFVVGMLEIAALTSGTALRQD